MGTPIIFLREGEKFLKKSFRVVPGSFNISTHPKRGTRGKCAPKSERGPPFCGSLIGPPNVY